VQNVGALGWIVGMVLGDNGIFNENNVAGVRHSYF